MDCVRRRERARKAGAGRVRAVMRDSDGLLSDVLSRLQGVRREGRQFKAICPAHADGTPSLSVRLGERGVLLKCYAGCTHAEVIEAIGLRAQELFYDYDPERREQSAMGERARERERESEQEPVGLTRAAFAEHKGLSEYQLAAWGVSDGIVAGRRAVLFAYAARDGSRGRTRIRLSIAGKGRFRWEGGDTPLIAYEPDGGALARLQRRLIIVEGESDTLTLLSAGFPALGLPGADTAKLITSAHLESVERVFVAREPDKGGDAFARNVPLALERLHYKGPVHTVRMPETVKDVSALYLREPASFSARLEQLLEAADPPRSKSLEQLFGTLGEATAILRTDFGQLDRACDDGGIPIGKLCVVVGGPGSRKTGFAVHLADTFSRQGAAVLMMCADEGRRNIVSRLAQRMGFSRGGMRDSGDIGEATRAEAMRRERKLDRTLRLTELEDEDDAQTIEDAHLELVSVAKGKPRVLIVDSLQTCRSESAESLERPDPRQEIDRKMRMLRGFRRTGTLVIVISETNRAFYTQAERRVEKEDVIGAAKESGGVEFGADLVLGIVRDREDENALEIVVAKSRFGLEPRFHVRWDRVHATLTEFTKDEQTNKAVAPKKNARTAEKGELRDAVYALILSQPGISQRDIRAAVSRGRSMVRDVIEELLYAKRIVMTGHGERSSSRYEAIVEGSARGEGPGESHD